MGFFITGCKDETYLPGSEHEAPTEYKSEARVDAGSNNSLSVSGETIVKIPDIDTIRSEIAKYQFLYGNLGKRSTEIMLGINGYVWNPDQSEAFDADSGENFFVFSAPVWDESSYCVGVSFLFKDVFSDWDDNFTASPESVALVGSEITWVEKGSNGPYYKYQVSDNLELCVYSDADGTLLLTEKPLLLKLTGTDEFYGLTSYDSKNLIVNSAEQQDAKWRIANETAESIGMLEEEIAPKRTKHIDELSNTVSYIDEMSQTEYYMDEGTCYRVNIPIGVAFPIWKGRDVISEEEFRKYFAVPMRWSNYHFMSWDIAFEDFAIYFPTDADRSIRGDCLISIQ
jgi:hypothetical protein